MLVKLLKWRARPFQDTSGHMDRLGRLSLRLRAMSSEWWMACGEKIQFLLNQLIAQGTTFDPEGIRCGWKRLI